MLIWVAPGEAIVAFLFGLQFLVFCSFAARFVLTRSAVDCESDASWFFSGSVFDDR